MKDDAEGPHRQMEGEAFCFCADLLQTHLGQRVRSMADGETYLVMHAEILMMELKVGGFFSSFSFVGQEPCLC